MAECICILLSSSPQVAILDSLSPNQKADLILDPTNLANESLVQEVFLGVLGSSDVAEIGQFFQSFVEVASKRNLTAIEPGLRDTLLNLTLTALAPKLQTLDTLGFKLWFQVYLPLFLPSIHSGTFSVIPRKISCDSYSAIIKGCDNVITRLSLIQSQQVFMFTKDYLTGQSIEGFSCVKTVRDDRDWLGSNFGQFRIYASYVDFVTLKSDFNGVKAADLLTPIQLAQLATIPSQLEGAQGVNKIMAAISPANFGLFFDILSPAIQKHMKNYTEEVKSAFLQVVFDSGNLSSTAINDTQFLVWLRVRLNPLLLNLSSNQVTPLFRIMKDRGCNSSQEAISLLDTLRSTLTKDTQREIYSNTLLLLKEPTPLRCYVNGSFYSFLRSTFLGFGFPDLSMLFTLMPDTRQPELLNSITSSELSQFLSQPDVVGNGSICAVFNNYAKTPVFLETEDVPDAVKKLTLPCVWSLALNSGSRSEVNAWFDLRLKNYLRFLTKSLVSSSEVQNASCLAFQKLVSVLGSNFNYNSSDFAQSDVYTTIKTYLGTGSGPKCYSANDPELNSTAWFVNYIGVFVTYLSLEDLNTFVTAGQINVFLENQANIKLFNNTAIPANVTSYYITQLYTQNPTFNPLQLPGFFLCEVPSTAYNSLSQKASMDILDRLKLFCNGTKDPQVSAALVANFQTITASNIPTIGNSITGLTTTQISSISSSVLVSSLATLGSVSGWNLGQASAVIQSITTGGFQINTASSLMSLGTLIAGIPSAAITSIPATELLTASQSSVFVTNMLAAPQIVQETYVNKIITINQSPNALVVNVPDAMATLIPRVLLTFSQEPVDVQAINRKTWTQEQAVLFLGNVASNASIDSEELSPSVLQGFTCTSAQSMTIKTVHRLVHACRPRISREKVVLKETQLTCMYNLLKDNLSQNFTDYPSDMLLYYNYAKVEKSNCRSYFSAASSADFSVLSSVLNKDAMLLDSAKSCLGISGVSLSKNHVEVLGNMVCTMEGSYIQNSDPFILEKLKNCKDFTEAQVTAMETLLLSGTTQYGKKTTWNQQTLEDLETLPLYLTQNFWSLFTTEVKGKFLKSFMPQLRKQETVKRKLKTLFKQINSLSRSKRGAGCITGNITQSVIADTSFPFGYDMTQFDLCLDTSILKDNLAAVTKQVDDNNFQKIILVKLNQAYPSGIDDEQLKVLGSVSRVATLDDITKWSITKIDTLSALMASGDGPWDTAKSKAIITAYLNTSGNSLGSSELNAIGANLCSLDVSVLKTITSSSLKNANSLDVTSCSTEQKRAVYDISKSSFSSQRISNTTYYQLISPYLGGAPIEDIRSLAAQNVSMDITTFKGLESTVVSVSMR
uniref:Mesothelin a n=1 Tax=Hucho hucho TaxID=62062 RepID=A0A4W5PYK8_9TELE